MATIGKSIAFAVGCFILLTSLLCGCGPDPGLIGNYVGYRDWKSLNISDESIAKQLSKVELRLKDGGKFTLLDGGLPFDGGWTRKGDKLELTVWTVMFRDIQKQGPEMQQRAANFLVSVDKDKKLTLTDAQNPKIRVDLVRDTSAALSK